MFSSENVLPWRHWVSQHGLEWTEGCQALLLLLPQDYQFVLTWAFVKILNVIACSLVRTDQYQTVRPLVISLRSANALAGLS